MSIKMQFLSMIVFVSLIIVALMLFGNPPSFLIVLSILTLIALIVISRQVIHFLGRLREVTKLMQNYVQGDLTKTIKGDAHGNEIDRLCWEANKVGSSLTEVLGSLKGANSQLSQAVAAFEGNHNLIEQGADEIRDFSQVVAASAEQSSVGTELIGNTVVNMSESMMSISAAMEEMVATASEIETRCKNENSVVQASRVEAKAAEKAMDELQALVDKIGAITQVIEEIASQTNLLALNATIEAAGAGEAGKGFTVVANEVKQLSKQTAHATGDIRRQVEQIQKVVGVVSSRIYQVTKVVSEIEQISHSTMIAVQEQKTATSEISRNLANSTNSTHQINQGIQEIVTGTKNTAGSVSKIHMESSSITKRLNEAEVHLKSIVDTTNKLEGLTGFFKAKAQRIELSAALMTKVQAMDDQHRKLVDMLNDLNTAVVEGVSKDRVLRIIDGLADYAVEHFSEEEAMLRKTSYPDYDAHIKIHQVFIDKVKQTRVEFEQGRGMVASEIVRFLVDWLINHIGKTDKKYGPYANKAGF